MEKMVKIKINGKTIEAKEGSTILDAASKSNIEIPTLCYHSDLEPKPHCRICCVQVKGRKGLYPACVTQAEGGMEVITDSEMVKKAIKINIELIFGQHRRECLDCVYRYNCQLLKIAGRYKADINRFKLRKGECPVSEFGPILFDSSKCIDCRNCVEMCSKQGVNFLEITKEEYCAKVKPSSKENRDCVYCGQCLAHCPVGAFESNREFEEIENPFKNDGKIAIVQFAPALRVSIGDFFDLPHGTVVTEKIAAALRRIGVSKVFDTSLGADFTTIEEAKELVARLKDKKNLPMFTSCCPSWVNFLEFNYYEFLNHLTSARSPHIILGGLIKTYWAEKNGYKPEDIKVISIMPCTSKKYEIEREELKIKNVKPVDYVLTTRELAYLFIRKGIDLKNVKPESLDNPFGLPSGAGVIYGASGGVMESALRTAHQEMSEEKINGESIPVEFKKVRGMKGVKEAKIKMGKKIVSVAVINGLGEAKLMMEKLRNGKIKYDYVEVMACPGGCIGGGGQPLPTSDKIRSDRVAGLYAIDSDKEIRKAHENPLAKEIYKDFVKSDKEMLRSIFHTTYSQKKKSRITKKHLNICPG
ncbi:MAG: [FeFe] hydrogenase, group A [Patescibacteria group bacterium]